MAVSYEKRRFKSLLNKHKFIDHWFWTRYGINPYNGCEFACTYCDSRSRKYYLHEDFHQVVVVKEGVGPMLDGRIRRARTLLPDVVGMSGTCDAYQRAEEVHENTRRCLEILCRFRYPVHIITKSPLVLRDRDLLGEIASNNWCTVSLTITTTDPVLSRFLEPAAPPPDERFAVLRELKAGTGVQAGVTLIPIVPLLADSESGLQAMVTASRRAGADYLLFGGGMTMRDRQAQWFLARLDESHPHLVAPFLELYQARLTEQGQYEGSYGPPKGYARDIHRLMFRLCREHGLPCRIPRFIPGDHRRLNYLIAGQFLDEAYRAQSLGRPWTALFWAGQNIQNLKESIGEVARRGDLETIRNVTAALASRIETYLATDSG